MFIPFFFHLRDRGLPVSITEFLTLLEALEAGLANASLTHFYGVARAILVKRVEDFDRYDAAFAEFFEDRPFRDPDKSAAIEEELLEWLEEARWLRELDEDKLQALDALDLEELREQFEERLQEQDERHDGGDHWVGTGGTSPFGHGGDNPAGLRIGGPGRRGRAIQVATKRRFKNLRSDQVLDTRQIGVALRKLRRLSRKGRAQELDLEATIDATAKNAGDIDLVFRPPRENQVKLLLLADVGGSMTAHSQRTSQLFSAAHKAHHFKHFKSYYFHNCIYETLYTDIARRKGEPTEEVLAQLDRSWRVVIVGDAAMAPSELMRPGGCIDYYHFNDEAGITWLKRIQEELPHSAWLNPDKPRWWNVYTVQQIKQIFPMHPLTVEGIRDAVEEIR